MSTGRGESPSRRARSTTGSRASPPSASSCTNAIADEFTRPLRRTDARAQRRRSDAAPTPTSARSRPPQIARRPAAAGRRDVCAGARSAARRQAARRDRATSTQPTVLADIPADRPPYARRCSVPSRRSSACATSTTRSRIANDTPFGLGASAWTRDAAEAERIRARLEAGTVFINGMVASDPRCRSAASSARATGASSAPWGLREFVNVKTVRRRAAAGERAHRVAASRSTAPITRCHHDGRVESPPPPFAAPICSTLCGRLAARTSFRHAACIRPRPGSAARCPTRGRGAATPRLRLEALRSSRPASCCARIVGPRRPRNGGCPRSTNATIAGDREAVDGRALRLAEQLLRRRERRRAGRAAGSSSPRSRCRSR